MTVYKYLPKKRLNVLDDRLLRFSQPSVLNDPFELLPSLPWTDDLERIVANKLEDPTFASIDRCLIDNMFHRVFADLLQAFGDMFVFLKPFTYQRQSTDVVSLRRRTHWVCFGVQPESFIFFRRR